MHPIRWSMIEKKVCLSGSLSMKNCMCTMPFHIVASNARHASCNIIWRSSCTSRISFFWMMCSVWGSFCACHIKFCFGSKGLDKISDTIIHLVRSICRWVELRLQNLITIRNRWEIATGTLTTLHSLALDGTVSLLSGSFLVLIQAHFQQSRYPDNGGELKLLLASSMHACIKMFLEYSNWNLQSSSRSVHVLSAYWACTLVCP